ncbi:protein-L-isoaspartate(D-aspartate) O-methyltransferase [Aureimonas sp. ME7]|uniref:protein-L-isoaspartate(D-aspartate) O-methyltransferase n=1 Tax=Aureimonas sp. ME7 TaxID=2744252 RepID=UPI0015F4209F|nr:protein-L-isoaspartate(D-aspartate) O-methyltransferase [Aureimonas sp. ME7]
MPADREGLASLLMRIRSEDAVAGRLMEAVEAVPRRPFVPAGVEHPYGDHSFPIACGQTMPSARTAVRLAAALRMQPEHRVLEIGTGSGYVTALLARLAVQVVSVDRYKTLTTQAEASLRSCGIGNVTFVHDDGRGGCPDQAPFDRIIVHGAFEQLPKTFVEQMASGGILVAAIGPAQGEQLVVRHQKQGSRFEHTELFPIRLQPLETGVATVL